MKTITFRLKGGPGSGFHGHKGILGHQGGSLPNYHPHIKFLSSPSDVTLNWENRHAYFISPDGEIIDMEGATHNGYLIDKAKYENELEEVFGVRNVNELGYRSIDKVLENGSIRVIWNKSRDEVDVHIFKIDVNSIRNIKNLIRQGKLPIAKSYYVDGTKDPDTGIIRGLNYSFTIPYEKLMHNAMTREVIENL